MGVDSHTGAPERREIRALWTGLLLPPVAVMANLEIAYALVPGACSARNELPVHLVHLICLLLAIGGGLISWRRWSAMGRQWPGEEGGFAATARLLAVSGVLGGGFFALVILAQWLPSIWLDPCG